MIQDVFNLISKTEDAKITDTKNIVGNKYLKKYNQVIEVSTEISLNTGLKVVKLYIALEEPYSVNLPKIFVDEISYNDIKYIPHINGDLSVCIVDEGDNFYFDEEKLPELTVYLIAKTKEILRGVDDKRYLETEFEREFLAYWNLEYNKNDISQEVGLCLVDFQNFENLKGIKFSNRFGIYKYLIYNDDTNFKQFESYLKIRGINSSEIEIFTADFAERKPPYSISFVDSLKYLQDASNFRSKINKLKLEDFIVIFKSNHNELYGWTYPSLNKKLKGYRPFSNWQFINSALPDNYVNRISFSNISPKRLDIRTSGEEINRDLKIAIVGLGSVGSNLLHYLTTYPVSEYCIIDPDFLKVENVFRNKFGFNYLNNRKAEIGKYEVLSKNPFTKVVSINKDIIGELHKTPDLLESYDYRFIIIGVSRIEKYIIQHMINIGSSAPLILIWVEPYMASGQLIFLHPKDFAKGIELLKSYPYHIIKNDQNLSLKEGSCQTGYMPYSDMHLNLFLSGINPKLFNIIIENNNKTSKIFSWVGDIGQVQGKGVAILDKYNSYDKFTLLENEL